MTKGRRCHHFPFNLTTKATRTIHTGAVLSQLTALLYFFYIKFLLELQVVWPRTESALIKGLPFMITTPLCTPTIALHPTTGAGGRGVAFKARMPR